MFKYFILLLLSLVCVESGEAQVGFGGGSSKGGTVTLGTTLAGEDALKDVQKVESRFLTIPAGGTTARIAADQLYSSAPGLVDSITCNSDATATAGTIAVLDSTAAGVGNVLYQLNVEAVAYTTPFTVPLRTPYSIGLFLDFTTTADMFCTLVYR
jgi:hypothetical protein